MSGCRQGKSREGTLEGRIFNLEFLVESLEKQQKGS